MPAEAVQAEAALAQPENQNGQPVAAPVVHDADPASKVMTRDDIRNARERRTKMARATRNKIEADRKDKANAIAYGQKVVARMEREGKL